MRPVQAELVADHDERGVERRAEVADELADELVEPLLVDGLGCHVGLLGRWDAPKKASPAASSRQRRKQRGKLLEPPAAGQADQSVECSTRACSGRSRLAVDEQPVPDLPGLRARALLAYLLLHPGPHARAHLAAAFWPDVLDTSARASLRSALAHVRARSKAVGGGAYLAGDRAQSRASRAALPRRGGQRGFDPLLPAGTPAALEEAFALADAPLLADLADDWALEAQDDYRERARRRRSALAEPARGARRLAQAVRLDAAARWRGDPPQRGRPTARSCGGSRPGESGRRRWRRTRAAAPCWRRSSARRRPRRRARWGVARTAQPTRALPSAARRAPRLPATRSSSAAPTSRGRGAAWKARGGRARRRAVVTGAAGIGKTRLAAGLAAARRGRGRLQITATRRIDLEGAPALAVWSRSCASSCARRTGRAPGIRLLARRPGAPLQRGRAAWGRKPTPPGRARTLEPRASSRPSSRPRLARAERPVLLVLEDVHGLDTASLALLAYVARRLARLPCAGRAPCAAPRQPRARAGRGSLRRGEGQRRAGPSTTARSRPSSPGRRPACRRSSPPRPSGSPTARRCSPARPRGRWPRASRPHTGCAPGCERRWRASAGPPAARRHGRRRGTAALAGRGRRPRGRRAAAGRARRRGRRRLARGRRRPPHRLRPRAAARGLHAELGEGRRLDPRPPGRRALARRRRSAAEVGRHLRLAGDPERALPFLASAAAEARALGAMDEAAQFLREAAGLAAHEPGVAAEGALARAGHRRVLARPPLRPGGGAARPRGSSCFEAEGGSAPAGGRPTPRTDAGSRTGLCYPREALAMRIGGRSKSSSRRSRGRLPSFARWRLAGSAWAEAVARRPRSGPEQLGVALAAEQAEATGTTSVLAAELELGPGGGARARRQAGREAEAPYERAGGARRGARRDGPTWAGRSRGPTWPRRRACRGRFRPGARAGGERRRARTSGAGPRVAGVHNHAARAYAARTPRPARRGAPGGAGGGRASRGPLRRGRPGGARRLRSRRDRTGRRHGPGRRHGAWRAALAGELLALLAADGPPPAGRGAWWPRGDPPERRTSSTAFPGEPVGPADLPDTLVARMGARRRGAWPRPVEVTIRSRSAG